jgi:hypothetical protein
MNASLSKFLSAAIAILRRYGWLPLAAVLAHEFCSHAIDAYRRWPPVDIPLHFFGGLAITYFFAGALRVFGERGFLRPPDAFLRLVLLFGLASTAAIFWEFAEFAADTTLGTHCQLGLADTLLDLFMGLSGSFAFLAPQIPAALRSFFHSSPASAP